MFHNGRRIERNKSVINKYEEKIIKTYAFDVNLLSANLMIIWDIFAYSTFLLFLILLEFRSCHFIYQVDKI